MRLYIFVNYIVHFQLGTVLFYDGTINWILVTNDEVYLEKTKRMK